ncbi:MAG: hypothetical protein Tsb0016_05320 [Sphingomonadales bacterium]
MTASRERILDAAWSLLESGQPSMVRMSDIAKAAGISRQAVYLHFPSRADLLIATTRHIDQAKNIDARLAASRQAATGLARLNAFIAAWGDYIPEIYGVAKALMAMKDSDEAAALAWADRMTALRDGCGAAIQALKKQGALNPIYPLKQAVDILATLLSVENWAHLTIDHGWPQRRYVSTMQDIARRVLVKADAETQEVAPKSGAFFG